MNRIFESAGGWDDVLGMIVCKQSNVEKGEKADKQQTREKGSEDMQA